MAATPAAAHKAISNAFAARSRNDHAAAAAHFERAVAVYDADYSPLTSSVKFVMLLHMLANDYNVAGDHTRALTIVARAVTIAQALDAKDPEVVLAHARSLSLMGAANGASGLPSSAVIALEPRYRSLKLRQLT